MQFFAIFPGQYTLLFNLFSALVCCVTCLTLCGLADNFCHFLSLQLSMVILLGALFVKTDTFHSLVSRFISSYGTTPIYQATSPMEPALPTAISGR